MLMRHDLARRAPFVVLKRSQASGIGLVADAGRGGAKHCWVSDPPGWPGRWLGLVIEWRQAGPWE